MYVYFALYRGSLLWVRQSRSPAYSTRSGAISHSPLMPVRVRERSRFDWACAMWIASHPSSPLRMGLESLALDSDTSTVELQPHSHARLPATAYRKKRGGGMGRAPLGCFFFLHSLVDGRAPPSSLVGPRFGIVGIIVPNARGPPKTNARSANVPHRDTCPAFVFLSHYASTLRYVRDLSQSTVGYLRN